MSLDLDDCSKNSVENNNEFLLTPTTTASPPTTEVSQQEEVEESISVSTTTVKKKVFYRHRKELSDRINGDVPIEHDDDNNEIGQMENGETSFCSASKPQPAPSKLMNVKFSMGQRLRDPYVLALVSMSLLFLLLIVVGPIWMRAHLNMELSSSKLECQRSLKNFTNFNSTLGYFKNKDWDLVLHSAIDRDDEPAVKILVDLGADVNRKNNRSETPLHRAAMSSDKGVALRLIKYLVENWADIFASDRKGYTFLHRLVDDGTTLSPQQFNDIATYLTSKNFSRLFNTPGGFTKGIRNPPRAPLSFQYIFTTPLQLAVKNLEVESDTLKMLHGNGVDFTVLDSLSRSVLAYAIAGKRSPKLLTELIQLGVDWKQLDGNNSTLMHEAALYGNVEGIRFLLSLGINIDTACAGDGGDSPLNWVTMYGKDNALETIRFLIENGANVKLENGNGETPLDRAMKRYDKVDKDKIVQLLRNNL